MLFRLLRPFFRWAHTLLFFRKRYQILLRQLLLINQGTR